jgi:hypothetical protein
MIVNDTGFGFAMHTASGSAKSSSGSTSAWPVIGCSAVRWCRAA